MKKDKIIFFDIDYTLFDTARFREKLFGMLAVDLHLSLSEILAKHQEVIDRLAKEKGFFDPHLYARLFAIGIKDEKKERNIFDTIHKKEIFLDNYYEETIGVLKDLSSKVTIGIFSKGETAFQKKKLISIQHFFQDYNVYITADKHKSLPALIRSQEGKSIYFVDDALDVLHTAKKLHQQITVVWVKRGKYALEQAPIVGFTPDAIIENLSELIPLIKPGGNK